MVAFPWNSVWLASVITEFALFPNAVASENRWFFLQDKVFFPIDKADKNRFRNSLFFHVVSNSEK
jgi:hypothetical protein